MKVQHENRPREDTIQSVLGACARKYGLVLVHVSSDLWVGPYYSLRVRDSGILGLFRQEVATSGRDGCCWTLYDTDYYEPVMQILAAAEKLLRLELTLTVPYQLPGQQDIRAPKGE